MSVKKKPFTLLELSAAMAVLMIFMLFIMRFFNASQDVMNRATSKTDQYERARIVMDLLVNDLQNIYYTEGLNAVVYDQTDSGTNTTNLSFYELRPYTQGNEKTDLAYVTYSFDPDSYTLKMGVAGEDQSGSWGTPLPDAQLGVLAEGVKRFQIIPYKAGAWDGSKKTTPLVPLTPADLKNGGTDKRRIPDFVRIELELIDSDSVEAYKNVKKISGGSVPDALDPSKDSFNGKDKIRVFSREVEIDRGQY